MFCKVCQYEKFILFFNLFYSFLNNSPYYEKIMREFESFWRFLF